PIGGLVDGGEYYVCNQTSAKVFQLCTKDQTKSKDETDSKGISGPITLTDPGATAGRSHSIVKGGTTPSGDSSATGPRAITETPDASGGAAAPPKNTDSTGGSGVSFGSSATAAVNIAGVINVENIHPSAHTGDSAQVNCSNPPSCTSNVSTPNSAQSV